MEIPEPDRMETGVFSVSNGARRFTRYGYADFFQQGSRYQLLFRLWPGTQRHLLSGDPETAAAFGRTSSFCGAAGLDIFEPLTFKGREGSGLPGGRCAYADASLNPKLGDWEKFEYFYRVWGRCLYNPDADSESWRRYLKSSFGPGAGSVRERFSKCQPCSGVGDVGSSPFGIESCLLGRDIRQHADRTGERAVALQRHAYPEVLWHRQSARSAALLYHCRPRWGPARGTGECEIFTHRSRSMVRGLQCFVR